MPSGLMFYTEKEKKHELSENILYLHYENLLSNTV
jgi:hypothetical protein